MNRSTHDRLRCQTCGRAALALFAYIDSCEARIWICDRCRQKAARLGWRWQPVTVTTRPGRATA